MSKFNEEFIKNYDENSDKGYILEVDVECLKKLHNLRNDLPFLPERMKIQKCHTQSFWQKQLCCTYKNFERSIKSRISFEKSA